MSFRTQAEAMRQKLENMERALQAIKAANQTKAASSQQSSSSNPGGSLESAQGDVDMTASDIPATGSRGQLNITEENETFIAGFSWESVIEDISEVKAFLQDEANTESTGSATPSDTAASPSATDTLLTSTLVQTNAASENKDILLQHLPPKADADRMVAAWFGSMDPYKGLLHVPSFQQQVC
jgi:hypothetical protein